MELELEDKLAIILSIELGIAILNDMSKNISEIIRLAENVENIITN